jgi:hypothetical protein
MSRYACWLIAFLLTACTADESISRDYRCSFIFDTSLHPLPCQLTGIIGNTGHFCKVSASLSQGITHLKTVRNYDGATEDVALTTAKESQITYALGANNSIIIGTSSYDFVLKAYDGQCPNCLSDNTGVNYPLMWQNNGQQLHCAKCGRSYDVNNGVVADGPSGRQLLAYMAAFDGSVLRAWN